MSPSAQQTSDALADLQASFAYEAMVNRDRRRLARQFEQAAQSLLQRTPGDDRAYVEYRLAGIREAVGLKGVKF
jgi:hypothetical protein